MRINPNPTLLLEGVVILLLDMIIRIMGIMGMVLVTPDTIRRAMPLFPCMGQATCTIQTITLTAIIPSIMGTATIFTADFLMEKGFSL